jgi:hypothetical protein
VPNPHGGTVLLALKKTKRSVEPSLLLGGYKRPPHTASNSLAGQFFDPGEFAYLIII